MDVCWTHKLQLSFVDSRVKEVIAFGFIQQIQAKIRYFIACVTRMCQDVNKFTNYLKSKAIPVQAYHRPRVFQISRQSAHEGGKVVSPTHRPPLPPGIIPGTHFCYRLSRPQGHSAAGRIMPMKNGTIGNRTRNTPACSAVPPPNCATVCPLIL